MASITDDRGYNQGFKETKALVIRTERRLDAIIAELDLTKTGASVLEMGCGTGLMSKLLSDKIPFSVTGIDLCQEFVDEANAKYANEKLKYFKVDLNKESDQLGKFDYIIGNGILHHLYHNLDQFLEGIKHSLKPGGKIIFWEPNLYNPYVYLIFTFPFLRKIAKLEPDEMAFTGGHIRRMLEKHGYQKIKVDYRDFLLPNTPDALIGTFIKVGNLMESTRPTSTIAQSIFLSASI